MKLDLLILPTKIYLKPKNHLDIKSVEFCSEETCNHQLEFVREVISDIRFSTKVLRILGDVLTHPKTIVESDQKNTSSILVDKEEFTLLDKENLIIIKQILPIIIIVKPIPI